MEGRLCDITFISQLKMNDIEEEQATLGMGSPWSDRFYPGLLLKTSCERVFIQAGFVPSGSAYICLIVQRASIFKWGFWMISSREELTVSTSNQHATRALYFKLQEISSLLFRRFMSPLVKGLCHNAVKKLKQQ